MSDVNNNGYIDRNGGQKSVSGLTIEDDTGSDYDLPTNKGTQGQQVVVGANGDWEYAAAAAAPSLSVEAAGGEINGYNAPNTAVSQVTTAIDLSQVTAGDELWMDLYFVSEQDRDWVLTAEDDDSENTLATITPYNVAGTTQTHLQVRITFVKSLNAKMRGHLRSDTAANTSLFEPIAGAGELGVDMEDTVTFRLRTGSDASWTGTFTYIDSYSVKRVTQ